MTFAQTWDVSCGTDDGASADPAPLASPASAACLGPALPQCPPELAAATPGGLRKVLLAIGPESARVARDFTTSTLSDWQLDSLAQEAVLIASELVTNAIRHGSEGLKGSRVELAWQRQATKVICMVTDRSPLPPVLGSAGKDAESGRGLQVVQALAATWGWMMLGATSKAVWAALAIPRQL
ncbi:MAG TPA: ATP-binding protein [Streptosporangiaceae bacterium]|nr:ATP-binding protein [Streptosporangiaceae bacterium]